VYIWNWSHAGIVKLLRNKSRVEVCADTNELGGHELLKSAISTSELIYQYVLN
jgi:hypothetical protein